MSPYISQDDRAYLNFGCTPRTPGELNYRITRILLGDSNSLSVGQIQDEIIEYIGDRKASYTLYNEIIGAITCAGLEFERRFTQHRKQSNATTILAMALQQFYDEFVVPYEDQKIKENGDVY